MGRKLEQREHFKMRAFSRFGIVVNRRRYRNLVALIKTLDHVEIRSNGRIKLYETVIDGIDVRLVYDTSRKTLVTMLPSKAVELVLSLMPKRHRLIEYDGFTLGDWRT